MKVKKYRNFNFGKSAEHTFFGRFGCSHGLRSGGFNYYVFGIKGIFNYVLNIRWGDFIKNEK